MDRIHFLEFFLTNSLGVGPAGWLAAARRVKGQRERVQRVEFAMGGHLVRRAWRVWDEFILDRPMKSALLLDVGVLRRKVIKIVHACLCQTHL